MKAGGRIPRSKRKYDWRTREGKVTATILSLELLRSQIIANANEALRDIDNTIASLK